MPLYTAGQTDASATMLDFDSATALRRMGLLRLVYQGDREIEPLVLAALPVFAPFWGYRIGRLVLADLERDGTPGAIGEWFERATSGEAFVMMRLLAKAPTPDWKAHDRLTVLRVQRPVITRYGLHTYAGHTTRAVLTSPDLLEQGNYVNTCLALLGCEETGTADIAAQLMVDNGVRLFPDQEELVRHTIRFFQRASKPRTDPATSRKAKRKAAVVKPPNLTLPDGSTFVQRYADTLLDRLIHGPDAAQTVRVLARFGWWAGAGQQIDPAVAFHLVQQLNLAFGRTAHGRGPDEAYLGVVDDLLTGTLLPHAHYLDRFRIVMYLVKHSVPTRARWNLTVDPSLHAPLAKLWSDKTFRKRESTRLEQLCKANSIGS